MSKMEINKRNVRTWSLLGARGTFGLAMQNFAEEKDFVIVTADLSISSGLSKYRELYPDRLIDVGIAEQNMIGVSSGMALEGEKVYATSFAPFITQRCLDQIRMNLGYMKLPVKLVGLSSGFEQGLSGSSHYGMEDAAVLRVMHGITIVTPADCSEIVKAIEASFDYDKPMYIRLTGGRGITPVYSEDYEFEIGRGIILNLGSDVLIIANGTPVSQCLKAAKLMEEEGISAEVVNMHTISPIDEELILQEAVSKKLVVTVEEHSVCGGLGTAVAEVLAQKGGCAPLKRIGMPDRYLTAGKHEYMMEKCALTAQTIADSVKQDLK